MIRKVFQVFLIVSIGIVLTGALNTSAQNQPSKDNGEFAVLFSGAVLGATLGALSVGFFEFSSEWASYCSGKLSAQELVKRHEERYTSGSFLSLMLGPAVGAAAGIVVVSQFYGLEGNIGLGFVRGVVGVGAGLGAGCFLLRATKWAALEFIVMVLPISWAAFGAVDSYNAQSRSSPHVSDEQTSSLSSMSLTLWSLRF